MYQRNVIGTTQSNGKSVISRRWKTDVKKLVNSYNFLYSDSHASGGKCDFCGNNLVYVAVITGDKIVTDDTLQDNVKYSIGFDCLELTLGKAWAHYNAVKQDIARLKEQAAAKKRAELYSKTFGDIINWLQKKTLPKFGFYPDMLKILTTGERVFSKNMEGHLRNAMEREKKNAPKLDEYGQKLEVLLEMIITLDKIDLNHKENIPTWSAYNFVSDVARRFKENSFLSLKQKEALNKIYQRYNERAKKVIGENKSQNTAPQISISDIMTNIPY